VLREFIEGVVTIRYFSRRENKSGSPMKEEKNTLRIHQNFVKRIFVGKEKRKKKVRKAKVRELGNLSEQSDREASISSEYRS